MKRKFSQQFVWAARDFIRAAKEELGHEFEENKVDAMLDAFDTSLKKQMFMEMLIGSNDLRIRRTTMTNCNKIQVIKAIRSLTGFGLKESKDIMDAADIKTTKIDGDWTSDDYNKLSRELVGTGYELV